MKTLKNLFNLLFKSKKTVAPAPQPTKKLAPPMFEENARTPLAVRTNGNRHHPASTTRDNIGRAFSVRREVGVYRSHIDVRSAEELLRDGHLRIALAGFNTCGLTINPFNIATNARLMEQASDLPTHIKMVAHPNVAAGLRISLQMLSRSPRGRTGILILSSGAPMMNSALGRELVQTAVKWRTAVHTIQIGHEDKNHHVLSGLATRSALGYGQFRKVTSQDDLLEAIRGALDSLAPARGMVGINSVVVLSDVSEKMVESFQGTTRIEMVAVALQEYLRNPLIRATENRMALAA